MMRVVSGRRPIVWMEAGGGCDVCGRFTARDIVVVLVVVVVVVVVLA